MRKISEKKQDEWAEMCVKCEELKSKFNFICIEFYKLFA